MPDGPRYDDDFYAWTQYQAEVLRTRDNRLHVAEEMEDFGRSYRDAVRSQVRQILVHLLKLTYSPADEPRHGCKGSIIDARAELEDRLSPTLRHDVMGILGRLYATARKRVAADLQEYGEQSAAASLPMECPYTLDRILADEWYPEPPEQPK